MPESDGNGGRVNSTQAQLVRVAERLALAPFKAHTPSALAADPALDLTRDQAKRTLVTMEHFGWAERAHGGWRLGPGAGRMSDSYRRATAERLDHYLGGDGEE